MRYAIKVIKDTHLQKDIAMDDDDDDDNDYFYLTFM